MPGVTEHRSVPILNSTLHFYVPDVRAPGDVRLYVRAQLGQWHLDDIAETAELVMSELVTNAVHASLGEIAVRLECTLWSVVMKVWDDNPGLPEPRNAKALAENGRGLILVDALSERWGYFPVDGGGKVVWAEVK
jgi:anti-sigma regulatory factor (Ser/Thr protein kinase)